MTLTTPIWLALLAPLALLLWAYRGRARAPWVLRGVLLVLVVLALAGPTLTTTKRSGTVILIADRSLSMPDAVDREHLEAAGILEGTRGAEDRLGVLAYGGNAAIELDPRRPGAIEFKQAIDRSGSNLGLAVRRALSTLSPGEPARIIVLSDGLATDDAAEASTDAAAMGVPIDFRQQARPDAPELAISQISTPDQVTPFETFVITATVEVPSGALVGGPHPVTYTLRRGSTVITTDTAELEPGRNQLVFRDTAPPSGSLDYSLTVSSTTPDPTPQNNVARALTEVVESSRILVITESPGEGLAGLLRSSGLSVATMAPSPGLTIEALAPYAAVILENVPIQSIGRGATEGLAALVTERGTGLMMTGGERSYAAGGYFQSAIDEVLPITMELRDEQRKLRTAIVVTMDRSGSMSAPVAGGRTKMELAGSAAASVIELLAPRDSFGAIAVDSAPHTVVDLMTVEQARGSIPKLRSLQSMGGGIYVYSGLTAATRMLTKVESGAKHIILFADAADAEEPGDYKRLLELNLAAGLTTSVVGLGTERDPDAAFLKDIAARGGGRIFFTNDPKLLPQIFTQDAVAVAKSAFLDEPTPLTVMPELLALIGQGLTDPPGSGGYNPTALRDGATTLALTDDEYASPFIATWNAGLGRSIAFTGEADGKHTGELAGWDDLGLMWTSLARSLIADRAVLGQNLVATRTIIGGAVRVDLYLTPEEVGSLASPTVRVIRQAPESTPTLERIPLTFVSTDQLSATIPLSGDEVIVPTIEIGDGRVAPLAPARLPYSPEFLPARAADGRRTLEQIAARTGGKERIALDGIWEDLPMTSRSIALTPWLIVLAVLVLLAEVAHRRIGLFKRGTLASVASGVTSKTRTKLPRRGKKQSTKVESTPTPPEVRDPGILSALGSMKDQNAARDRRNQRL